MEKTLKWKWIRKACLKRSIRKACLKRSRQNKLISHHQTLLRKLLALHIHRNYLSAAHGDLPAQPHQKPMKLNGNVWEVFKSHWNRLNESKVFFLCIITNYRWYHKLQPFKLLYSSAWRDPFLPPTQWLSWNSSFICKENQQPPIKPSAWDFT